MMSENYPSEGNETSSPEPISENHGKEMPTRAVEHFDVPKSVYDHIVVFDWSYQFYPFQRTNITEEDIDGGEFLTFRSVEDKNNLAVKTVKSHKQASTKVKLDHGKVSKRTLDDLKNYIDKNKHSIIPCDDDDDTDNDDVMTFKFVESTPQQLDDIKSSFDDIFRTLHDIGHVRFKDPDPNCKFCQKIIVKK